MAIVLELMRSPSDPSLGLSGSGRLPPLRAFCGYEGEMEKPTARSAAANTQITRNGHQGRRRLPIVTPECGGSHALRNTHKNAQQTRQVVRIPREPPGAR